MVVVEEQEDKRWEYLEFRLHGVLVPRGMCSGKIALSKGHLRNVLGELKELQKEHLGKSDYFQKPEKKYLAKTHLWDFVPSSLPYLATDSLSLLS
ncbi:hypothetical protein NDU88_010555 [Pleurodeles waltl]|uniref:Uncharacterized protein n=1 Tax=Pleurodeles waltl TaxID=8319 RepID=A0AAV7QUR9_PLEWA|nr:hypothetical protein NDU88_010555 [Pleurodeles waltl]